MKELEVARALAFPIKSIERIAAIAQLRREGDYSKSVDNVKHRSQAIAVR